MYRTMTHQWSTDPGGGRITRLSTGIHGRVMAGMADSRGASGLASVPISISGRGIGITTASTFATLAIQAMATRGSTTQGIVTGFLIVMRR